MGEQIGPGVASPLGLDAGSEPEIHHNWLRGLLDLSDTVITALDLEGRIVFINPAGLRGLGHTRLSEVQGRHAAQVIPAVKGKVEARIAAALRGERPHYDTPVDIRGEQHIFRSTYEPVTNGDGVPMGIRIVSQDVTALLDASEKLKTAQIQAHHAHGLNRMATGAGQRLATILENAPVIILTVGRDHYARYYNYLPPNWTDEEALRTPLPDAIAAHDRPEFRENLARAFEGETVNNISFEGVKGRFWEGSLAPLPEGDRVDEVLLLIHDVTDLVHAEKHRQRMEEKLHQTQRLESLGVLAGGLAHDFNNIFARVLGNVDAAQHAHQTSAEGQRALAEINDDITQAAGLCRQLLAYAGQGQFALQTCNLNDLIGEMQTLMAMAIKHRGSLYLTAGDGRPWIKTDVAQIRQLLLNLIDNAADALGPDGGGIRIEAGVMDVAQDDLDSFVAHGDLTPGAFAYLKVSDTGVGIDSEVRRHIFEPFFTTKSEGRGLGLPASLGIVRGLKGAIRLDSTRYQGTEVTCLFPLVEAPSSWSRVPSSDPGEKEDPAGVRVLVVDDEDRMRRVVSRALQRVGMTVTEASDGEQAVRALQNHLFDAALVDLTMPGMDGLATVRALREVRPGLPAVLMSGYSREVLELDETTAPTLFLAKPFSPDALIDTLQEVVRPKR